MSITQQLQRVISEYHLLKHPFYQAWSRGELTQETLKTYAKQYYHQVQSFPRFISRVHTECPMIEARKVLLENLVDEEIHGKDHPQLWMQFAEGLGESRQEVMNEQAIPETQLLVDKFYELAGRDWRDGLCALYAYESQVPEVSTSKIAGLKQFYNITDEATLEFFTAHQEYDVGHAKQVATLIDRYVEKDRAVVATQEAAQALWGFLDGMCRVSEIHCAC
ncbi:MAG: hypothetical protein A3E82_09355 [Gammaproteobacteria bacterium RIFCSPHIGHO2_12_FULL_38_11]|nr:MAG: hypothetical protein A3E82_09355 [Gammaproteobacteria bacterium RIFCSPHIGHO2_12_FULL_38_11]